MTSTKITDSSQKQERKKRINPPAYPAPEKAQAVLAVWTERCRISEVCHQLNITRITFDHWQTRAMEGMLQALENRVNLAKGEALSPRLQALLQQRQQTVNVSRLTNRLEQINKLASPPPLPAKTE
jgi:transposase-like protein